MSIKYYNLIKKLILTRNKSAFHVNSVPLRPCPHVFKYIWIHNFFFLDTASVHWHPANSAANPDFVNTCMNPRVKK